LNYTFQKIINTSYFSLFIFNVATLALGSRPMQGLARLQVKREARKSHHMYVLGSAKGAKSVREWTFTLPSELPLWELDSQMDSQIFKARLEGSKPINSKNCLHHWKFIETYMFKMGSHDPFGHLKHKLWSKERPGVKLAVWLPTIKSHKLTLIPHM
jgi:hypothetical protein